MLRSALVALTLIAATVPAMAMDLPHLSFPEAPAAPTAPTATVSTQNGK